MTATLTLRVSGSMRSHLQALLPAVPCGVLMFNAWRHLIADHGGDHDQAAAFLVDLADRHQKPLLLNFGEGESTVCLAPASWSAEKTMGYVAGLHEHLEAAFGEISAVRRAG